MTIASPWTIERIERLRVLYKEGKSASQIAIDLGGTTRSAIIGKCHRLNLEPRGHNYNGNGAGRPAKVTKSPTAPKTRSGERKFKIISACGNSSAVRIIPRVEGVPFGLRCVEVDPLNLTFAQLKDDLSECRYPDGDDPAAMTFCGLPISGSASYCISHTALCYTAPLLITEEERERRRRQGMKNQKAMMVPAA